MPEMTAEERALRIAPEGCNGEHPKGGCLFERVRDEIFAARREGEERMRERAEDEIKDTIKGVEMEATDVRDTLFGALGRVHALRYEGCTTVEKEPRECPYCHYSNVTDEWVYVCPSCGAESCPDCAGRCGCPAAPGEEDA